MLTRSDLDGLLHKVDLLLRIVGAGALQASLVHYVQLFVFEPVQASMADGSRLIVHCES